MEQKTVLLKNMIQIDTTKTPEITITLENSEVQETQTHTEEITIVLTPPLQEVASTTQGIRNQTEAITDQVYQTLAEEELPIPVQVGEDLALVQEEVAVEEVYHGEEDKKYTKSNETQCELSLVIYTERKTRLELATPTLARLCSTN